MIWQPEVFQVCKSGYNQSLCFWVFWEKKLSLIYILNFPFLHGEQIFVYILILLIVIIGTFILLLSTRKNEEDENDLLTVYEPGSEAEYVVLASIFEEQKIPFSQKNQAVQNLFGHGSAHSGFNPITGPIKIQVKRRNYDKAHQIINDYKLNLKNHIIDAEDFDLKFQKQYHQLLTSSVILGLVIPGSGIYNLIKAIKLKSESDRKVTGTLNIYFSSFLNSIGILFWYYIFLH